MVTHKYGITFTIHNGYESNFTVINCISEQAEPLSNECKGVSVYEMLMKNRRHNNETYNIEISFFFVLIFSFEETQDTLFIELMCILQQNLTEIKLIFFNVL